MRRDSEDERLERFLRQELGDDALVLERRDVPCISRVYRASTVGGRRLFVKWGFASAACAAEFLRRQVGHPLLPERVLDRELAFEEHPVSVFAWREVRSIPVECMNDAQYASLLAARAELSALLNEPGMVAYMRDYVARTASANSADVRGPAVDPCDCLETVRAFAAAHPLVRWLLRPLLSIKKESLRRDPEVRLTVNHGDFHAGNFGFSGDRLVVFFDFDNLAFEYSIEDMVRLFCESAIGSSLTRSQRRLLMARFAEYVRSAKRPADEWRFAIDRLRLYYARNTLMRHFSQPRVAVQVVARDCRLKNLLKTAVREVSA